LLSTGHAMQFICKIYFKQNFYLFTMFTLSQIPQPTFLTQIKLTTIATIEKKNNHFGTLQLLPSYHCLANLTWQPHRNQHNINIVIRNTNSKSLTTWRKNQSCKLNEFAHPSQYYVLLFPVFSNQIGTEATVLATHRPWNNYTN